MKAVYKTADESRSTVSATNDADLQFNFLSGKTYAFRGQVVMTSGDAPDAKIGFSCAGAVIAQGLAIAYFSGGGLAGATQFDKAAMQAGSAYPLAVTGSDAHFVQFNGVFTASEDGTFAIVWAQNVYDAVTPVTLKEGSVLLYEELPA